MFNAEKLLGKIEEDTEAEVNWLNALGDQVGLSPGIRRFIED